MASVQTNSYEGRYLKLTVVEESTSIANNTSTVKWTLESIGGSSTYYSIYNCSVVVNGQTVYNPGTVYWDDRVFPAKTGSTSGTITVNHKADGSADPISFTLHGRVYNSGDDNVSGSLALSTIPRYTSITSFLVGKRNETSFTINWSTADTVDYVWYSTNNGSSWTGVDVTDGKSGSFTISGLSPNTTYNCKLRVRRKDSQLTTDSSTVSQTTYKAPSQSLSSKTETSITMSWSCDTTANHIWYSKDNGSTWVDVGSASGTSGTYTIPNLTADTPYNIKTRVRRSSTNTTYDSAMSTQTTYDYPHITDTPNFIIGDAVYLTLYNPLGRNCTVVMYGDDWSVIYSGDGWTGTSVGDFKYQGAIDNLYLSIPDKQVGNYHIKVVYDNVHKDKVNAGTYSVRGTEVPTFSNFAYKDSNTNVTTVTGNDQIMVKGLSTVQVTVSSANKMVANNSATPNYYKATISNLSANGNYSTSDVVINLGIINNSGTQRLNVEAYDSRNLSTLVYKDITVYDYIKPVVNATLTRLNDFESETTLKVNGTYTKLAINNVNKNSITNVKYRYRETGGTWNNWTNITTTNNNGNFTCNDVVLALDNTKSFEFEIQATDSLQQVTTLSANVDVGQAIFFISTNNRTAYVNGNEVVTNNYTGDTNQTGNATITGNTTINGTAKVNGNIDFQNNNDASILWKEYGYGDKFKIVPAFGGSDDDNKLKIQGTVGGAGTDPTTFTDLMTITGKNGNVTIKGNLTIGSFTRNTTDTWIPVLKSGELQYTLRKIVNSKTHTDFNNNQDYLATMSFLSYWNGAYNSSNASNLTYAHQGEIQCKPVTLWTNSNVGAVFNAQTINISNLSSYKCIDIIYYPYYPGSSSIVKVERHYYDTTRKMGVISDNFRYQGVRYCGTREYTVNAGNIQFADAKNDQNSNDNNWYKPYQIIGYK